MRSVLLAAALVLALAAPAGAAMPKKAEFWNGSHANGAAFYTSAHTVKELQFFCKQRRYSLERNLHVRKDGTFSFSGKARKYGSSGQPQGLTGVRLHGRFTSPSQAKITRRIHNCGGATVTVTAGARTS